MKRFIGRVTFSMVFVLAIGGAISVASLLLVVDTFVPPTFSTSFATVQNITTKSWLVFDMETGQDLYSYQSGEVVPIASITKLVAAKVFSDKHNLWATTSITWSDVSEDGRAGKLGFGEQYMYHTLLFPLLLESSNDAAHVFSRNEPALIEEMNNYTANLSLPNTHFADTSGLDDGNVSSANDLKVILRNIYAKNPHIIDITSLKEYYSLKKGWLNNNPYISQPGYIGGKHGYTYAANRTALVIFDETLRNGVKRKVGYVLLGSSNLDFDMSLLRDYVQNNVNYQ